MKGEMPGVGGRVSQALKEQLIAFCQETGQTESQVVRAALSAYLGVNTPDTVEALHKRVATLERQYKKLAQLV